MTPLLKVKLNRRRDKVHIERGVIEESEVGDITNCCSQIGVVAH